MDDRSEALAALFSMSRESVIGVKNGRIAFMNPTAVAVVGRSRVGDQAIDVLPEHLVRTQAESFLCSAELAGKKAAVSATTLDGIRLFLFTFQRGESRPGDMHSSLAPPIRTAIANVKLATERLQSLIDGCKDERLRYCTRVLDHSYHQLWRLLRNVSAAGELERGEITFLPVLTDLAAVCREVALICASYAEERGVELIFEPMSSGLEAVADVSLIRQMLLNLLTNSLQHTPVGGRVSVAVSKRGGSILISVDDDGDGISQDILPTVFCRWMQTKELTDTSGGAGLGLSVARGVAELHGGALVIESRTGKGTAVRVMLPVDNSPTLLLQSSVEEYSGSGKEDCMTFLSTWLPSDEYGRDE